MQSGLKIGCIARAVTNNDKFCGSDYPHHQPQERKSRDAILSLSAIHRGTARFILRARRIEWKLEYLGLMAGAINCFLFITELDI